MPLQSALTGFLLVVSAASAAAQYAERPDLLGSGSPAVDASGRSIKSQRIRAVHARTSQLPGTTGWLIRRDPYLAYQLGRNLNYREFRDRDGIFSDLVSQLGGPMPDPAVAKITANNQVSCLGCHNVPSGNPGGGPNFAKDSGMGRNTPHYYGAGIVEMLALQIRAELLDELDEDESGWVSAAEAMNADPELEARAIGGQRIDFGDPRLSGGSTGSPSLNNVLTVWYVDANGHPVPGAVGVDNQTTFGYSFHVTVWGWGQGAGRSALNPTNRAFLWDPFKAHSGLEACDPSSVVDPDGDGVTEPTLSGAIQFPVTHLPPDGGSAMNALGFSEDDPDGDGYLNEISEGDLDLGEWFMLNAPRPAFAGVPKLRQRGEAHMEALGCTECHVPDWEIQAADDLFAGDRRVFDLDVTWNQRAGRLEGSLVDLGQTLASGDVVPRGDEFVVRGLYSDLRHHDMGPDLEEVGYDGVRNSLWRTPPLWGVGSGFPWGHDGACLTLHEVIVRHGGEAAASRDAFVNAPIAEQRELLEFLEALVLYDLETLPTDMDGDGQIAQDFVVAGVSTGEERFNPEWLFRVPVRIQGWAPSVDGTPVMSCAALNRTAAYGEDLPARVDTDQDGWPDVMDAAPTQRGYRDGVND